MSVEDKIEARINAEFVDKETEPSPNGNHPEPIDICGEDLDEDNIRDHELVDEVLGEVDGRFHLLVSARRRIPMIRVN